MVGKATPKPKYKTYARGEAGTKSGTGGGTPTTTPTNATRSTSTSSYTNVQSATGQATPGTTYTTPTGATVTTQEKTSYTAVASERERLVKEAEAKGTATTQQSKEAAKTTYYDPNYKTYVESVNERSNALKRQGIQTGAEYFAAVQGETSPRQTSYENVKRELDENKRIKERARQAALAAAPIYPTAYITDTKYYDGKGNVWELGTREKAVIATAEKVEQLEQARAERYQAFEARTENIPWYYGGVITKYGSRISYAVGVGYGETLASVAAKTFIYVGAATSPILKDYAKQGATEAYENTKTELAYQYDPTTARGWGNIALTAGSIYLLGKYRAQQRNQAKAAAQQGTQAPDKITNKFNIKRDRQGNLKTDASDTTIRTTTTQETTARNQKLGEVTTNIYKPDADEIITEKTTLTTPSKQASIGYPDRPNAKVTITYAQQDGTQVTTTNVKGLFYNYERETITTGGTSQSYYYKINKITGQKTYVGTRPTTTGNEFLTTETITRGKPIIETKEGVNAAGYKETDITTQTSYAKKGGVRIDTTTQTESITTSRTTPSQRPPKEARGMIVEQTPDGLDATPFTTKVQISTEPTIVKQPNQQINIDAAKPSITRTTPELLNTEQQVNQVSVSKLTFNTPIQKAPSLLERAKEFYYKNKVTFKFQQDTPETPIRIKIGSTTSNTQNIDIDEVITQSRLNRGLSINPTNTKIDTTIAINQALQNSDDIAKTITTQKNTALLNQPPQTPTNTGTITIPPETTTTTRIIQTQSVTQTPIPPQPTPNIPENTQVTNQGAIFMPTTQTRTQTLQPKPITNTGQTPKPILINEDRLIQEPKIRQITPAKYKIATENTQVFNDGLIYDGKIAYRTATKTDTRIRQDTETVTIPITDTETITKPNPPITKPRIVTPKKPDIKQPKIPPPFIDTPETPQFTKPGRQSIFTINNKLGGRIEKVKTQSGKNVPFILGKRTTIETKGLTYSTNTKKKKRGNTLW